ALVDVGGGGTGGRRVGEQGVGACGGAAVARAGERGQSGADRAVQVRAGGGDHARGEGRDVELVVGAQHQRRAHQVREGLVARAPGVSQQPVHGSRVGRGADQQRGVLAQQGGGDAAARGRGGIERVAFVHGQQRDRRHRPLERRQ